MAQRTAWTRISSSIFKTWGFVLFWSVSSFANTGITYHGKILKPNGDPVDSNNVQFRIQVRTPGPENCLLWEESQSRDMSTTAGVFTLTIGDVSEPTRVQTPVTNPNTAANFSLDQVFSNRYNFASGLTGCSIGNAYSPTASDGRSLVVSFRENPGDPWEQMPVTKVNFVPMAMNSLQLEGFRASEFLQLQPSVTQTPLSQTQVNTLLAILNGTAGASFDVAKTDSFVGDVTGPYNNTVVARIRGVNVSATAPANGQVLKLVGGVWTPSADDTGAAPGDATYAAKGVVQVDTSQAVSGLTLASGILSMPNVIAAAGPIGSAQNIPVITYDSKGRLITVSTTVVDDTTKLPLAGGTLTGPLNMGSQNITNANNISATNVSANAVSTRSVVLNDNDTNTVTLRTPNDITTNYTLTLPAAVPTNGFVLSTNGAGDLSWVDPTTFSGAGQFSNGGNSFAAAATLGTNDNFALNFETNGTTKMTVLANGNVGIGTVTPSRALDVNAGMAWNSAHFGATNDNEVTFSAGNRAILHLYAGAGVNPWQMRAQTSSRLDFVPDSNANTGTPTLTLRNDGNVGIGTTSPNSSLQIERNTNADNSFSTLIARNTSNGSSASTGIAVANDLGNIGTLFTSSSTASYSSGLNRSRLSLWSDSTNSPGIDLLAARSNAEIRFFTGGDLTANERMKIDSTGRVGIGQISPATRLDIAGTLKIANGAEACSIAGDGGMIRYNGGNLQFCNGSAWQTLGVSGAGLTSLGGQTGSTQTFAVNATGTAPAINSATNVHTLSIPLASGVGVTSGTISKTDYDAFIAKLTSPLTTKGDLLSRDTTTHVRVPAGTNGQILSANSATASGLEWITPSAGDITGVTAGAGLITGGTAGDVTLDVGAGTGIVVNADNVAVDVGLAANRIPQVGGTALGAGGAIVANGTGTALSSLNCTLGQVIKFDVSGFATCGTDDGGASSTFVQNGNSFGAAATLGTNDNFALNFETNGTTKMTVLANGNVGIGTTNPATKLEVSTGTSNEGIRITSSGTGGTPVNIMNAYLPSSSLGSAYLNVGRGSTNYEAGVRSFTDGVAIGGSTPVWYAGLAPQYGVGGAYNYSITEYNGTTNSRLTIIPGGNIGIGTSSPNTILDINGAFSQRSMVAPALSPAGQGRIYFDSTSNKFRVSENGGAYTDLVSAAGSSGFLNGGNSFGAAATLGTNDNFALNFETNGTSKMTILPNGHTGIGTSTPFTALEVTGDILLTSMNDALSIRDQSANVYEVISADSSNVMTLQSSWAAGAAVRINADNSTGYVRFDVNDVERMRVTSSGNVGIGTSSPNTALDVNGALSQRSMAAPALSPAGQGRIYFDSTSNKFRVSENGGAYADLVSAAGSSGFLNGGNSFGAAATLGTNDNFELNFETNGSTRMTISNSGNVGLGAPPGIHRLQLTGDIYSMGGNHIFQNDRGIIDDSSWTQKVVVHNTDGVKMLTGNPGNSIERMRVTIGGNVGIGTQTPMALLDLGTNSPTLRLNRDAASINNGMLSVAGSIRTFDHSTAQNYGEMLFDDSDLYLRAYPVGGIWRGNIILQPNANGLGSQGYVGIATTSPNTVLDINGAFSQRSMAAPSLSPAGQGRIYFDSTANKFRVSENGGAYTDLVGSGGAGGFQNGGNSFAGAATLGTNDNFGLNFETNNATRMIIDNSGNITIGNVTPTRTLDINVNDPNVRIQGWNTSQFAIENITNTANTATIRLSKSGNNSGSMTLPAGADVLGSIKFNASNSTSVLQEVATLEAQLEATPTNTSMPTFLSFATTPSGSTSKQERMRITGAGNVGIGTSAPENLFHVLGRAKFGNLTGYDSGADIMTNSYGGSYVHIGSESNDFLLGTNVTNSALRVTLGDLELRTGGGWNSNPTADGTVRLIVKNAGSVGIGTTNPGARLDVTDTSTTTSAIIVPRAAAFTGTTVNGMVRYNSTSNLFEFRQNGSWVNYTVVSDGRLKTNIEPVTNGLDIVNQLNPVFYDWDKSNPRTASFDDKHEVGFIAQEVEKVLPEVVNKGEDDYRSLEYGKMVAVVVDAVKTLYKRVLGIENHNSRQDREIASIQAEKADKTELAELREKNQKLEQQNASQAQQIEALKAYLCAKDAKAAFCQ